MLSEEIESWYQVNTLLQHYADAVDRGDVVAIVSLFSADAIWDYGPGNRIQGRQKIKSFFDERLAAFEQTHHHIASPVITPGNETSGYRSTAYFTAQHRLKDQSRYTVYGRYVDFVILDPEGARFKSRRIVAHMSEGTSRKFNLLDRMLVVPSNRID